MGHSWRYHTTDLSHHGPVPGESCQDCTVDEVALEVTLRQRLSDVLTYPEETEDHGTGEEEVEDCDLQSSNIEGETIAVGNGRPEMIIN